jgi:exopolysaccharide production protein ExoQ
MDRALWSRIDNGHIFGASAFIVPIMGIYAPLGLAPLIMAAAIACLLIRRVRDRAWPIPTGFAVGICILAMAWSAASILWSIDPATAHLSKLVRLALLLLAGLVLLDCARALDQVQRNRFKKLMVAGMVIASLLLLVDYLSEGAIQKLVPNTTHVWGGIAPKFNRGVTNLALIIWPVAFVLWRWSSVLATLFCVAILILVSGFTSSAAIVAIIVGLVCCVLTYLLPRIIPAIVALGMLISIFAGPMVSQSISPDIFAKKAEISIPNSAYHRLLIWQFTAGKIAERPILGWGFNSSKSIPGNTRDVWKGSSVLPLHPHNAWLQWWLELGVVGAALGAVLCAGIAWRLRDPGLGRAERAASLALLVAAFVIGGVAYGAWQSWWLAAILFSAAFMSGCLSPPDERQSDMPSIK